MFRQSIRVFFSQNEIVRYFRFEIILEKFFFWQYWKNNVSSFSKLTQIIKNILSYSIFSIKIERFFNFAKKMCIWDRAQLNSKFVEQIMFLKYYNRTMNLNFEKTFIESWNIFRKKKNIDRDIDKNRDFFKIFINDVLR